MGKRNRTRKQRASKQQEGERRFLELLEANERQRARREAATGIRELVKPDPRFFEFYGQPPNVSSAENIEWRKNWRARYDPTNPRHLRGTSKNQLHKLATHRENLFPVLKNIQRVGKERENVRQRNKTMRNRLALAEEIKFLPPIEEVRFPGGNEYRKAQEEYLALARNQQGGSNTNEDLPLLPKRFLQAMVDGNEPLIREMIDSGEVDIEGEYQYEDERNIATRTYLYKGTPLGFALSLPLYEYETVIPRGTILRAAHIKNLYRILTEKGAKNMFSYFKDTHHRGHQDHSTLALAIAIDQMTFNFRDIINNILKETELRLPWTDAHTNMELDDIRQVLKEVYLQDRTNEALQTWRPVFQKMAQKTTHKGKMETVLENIKVVPNTRRKKRNVREELKFLPPIPEMGFPGGNEYRKAAEQFEESKTL
jgi:hypothetical protein